MMVGRAILGIVLGMLGVWAHGAEDPPPSSAVEQVEALVAEKRLEEAERLARRLLTEAERTFGAESLPAAEAIDALQFVQWHSRKEGWNGDEAMRRVERAVRIKERILGPRHLDVAFSLSVLLEILLRREEWSEAEVVALRVVNIRESLLGQDSVLLARAVSRLALTEWFRGDFATARRDYDRAMTIFQNGGGPSRLDQGILTINMSSLFQDMGDYEAARILLENHIALAESENKPVNKKSGTMYHNLCHILRLMGDYSAARPMCERCLEIWEVHAGPQSGEVAGGLQGLAELLTATGNVAAARPLMERALAIRQQGKGTIRDRAEAESFYGNILALSGDLDGARAHLEEGVRNLESVFPAEHPTFVKTRRDLGEVYWKLGDAPAAWDSALRAAIIGRKSLSGTAAGLSERESLRYEETRQTSMDLLVSLLLFSDPVAVPRHAASLVLNEVIRSRAIVLDEMAARHRELSAATEDVEALKRTLVFARNRRSRLLMGGGGTMANENYRELVAKADKDVARAERNLAARSIDFRQRLQREQIGFEPVAAALPRGSALVAYVKFERINSDIKIKPLPSYMAFVLGAGAARPTVIPLGAASEIDAVVLRWRKEAGSNPQVNGEASSEASYREAGAALRERTWDPVAANLGRREVVFLVPDGLLSLVNFATLPHREGGYLIETGPPLHYLSAERDLVRDRPAPPAQRTLLALGGPDFDARPEADAPQPALEGSLVASGATYRSPASTCPDLRTLRFEPLNGSRVEIEEIESLWSQKGRVVALTGGRAREDALKRNAPGFNDLHIATHGFFMEDSCKPEQAGLGTADNPLLLSGLALSGANGRHALPVDSEEEDGILTAEEISTLDLTDVHWVVLSACGTGLGKVVTGEGVLGLRRAFEVAGAGTLIMSLWNVEDDATRVWMRGLYEERLAGRPAVEAVRSAGMKMIENQRRAGRTTHPFYWGGFVAAGDWR